MKRSVRALLSIPTLFGMALAAPAHAQVTVGVAAANTGNCFPIGCNQSLTRYQQVYTSSAFSGLFNIGSITFFHTVFNPGTANYAAGTYNFSLGTTTTAVNNLSPNYALNNTSPLSLFATVIISPGASAAASTFTFSGNPFLYNPGAGNLLLDVSFSNSTPSVSTFLDADNSGISTSRAYGSGTLGSADATGLVTRFGVAGIINTTAPEPASVALMAFGLGIVGFAGLRRRQS